MTTQYQNETAKAQSGTEMQPVGSEQPMFKLANRPALAKKVGESDEKILACGRNDLM